MTRLIFCTKLQKEAQGFNQPPMAGELGKKIYDHISEEAWKLWLQHQTILINEYRLSLIDSKSRTFLLQEMDKFLFGTGSEKPAAFVPPES